MWKSLSFFRETLGRRTQKLFCSFISLLFPPKKAKKSSVFTKKRAFILILSADTIRLSAGRLIAFENFLIVFWNSPSKSGKYSFFVVRQTSVISAHPPASWILRHSRGRRIRTFFTKKGTGEKMPQGCERTQLVAFENCWRSSEAQTSRTGLTSQTGRRDRTGQRFFWRVGRVGWVRLVRLIRGVRLGRASPITSPRPFAHWWYKDQNALC